jgi:hypothetical protein
MVEFVKIKRGFIGKRSNLSKPAVVRRDYLTFENVTFLISRKLSLFCC